MVLNGSYRILEPLASGGVGRVYLAAHERLPGRVAVKVLHRSFLRDKASLARFRNEAEILAGLNHPNIVRVLDYNISEGGFPYLVMELIEGVELRRCIGQPAQRTPGWVASAVRQVAGALRVAHLKGIVHRDVKPENLMVCSVESDGDFVKVLDFGISNVYGRGPARGGDHRDGSDTIAGTPGYMPPEQLAGDDVDDRADQFALAAVAYELLGARPAFFAADKGNLMWKILNEDPLPLADLCDWPAAGVDRVLRRALAKRRDDRFPDVQEFARALQLALTAAAAPRGDSDPAPAATSESAVALAAAVAAMPPLPEADPAAVAVAAPVAGAGAGAMVAAADDFAGVGDSYLW
jgi:eukaryotic-like serine/threonine-protein kinase